MGGNGTLTFLRHAELVSASIPEISEQVEKWTLKQVQGDGFGGECDR